MLTWQNVQNIHLSSNWKKVPKPIIQTIVSMNFERDFIFRIFIEPFQWWS